MILLKDVPDSVFSQKLMGDGFAIIPQSQVVVSPISGVAESVFPTGHAVGIKTKDGIECIVHIGLDTVELNGEPFTMHVKKGDKVKKGQLLVDVDLKAIEAAGKETATAVIITNGKAVNLIKSGAVDAKTDVVEIANPVVEVKAA